MSTIISANVSDGTLSIPTTFVTNGSAKAWVNFNGTGTIAARDSLNLSSLTDNGTGNYTINFTNAFSAADYTFALGISNASGVTAVAFQSFGTAPTTTALRVISVSSAGFDFDTTAYTSATHGDLA
jgi:hypothetical protein